MNVLAQGEHRGCLDWRRKFWLTMPVSMDKDVILILYVVAVGCVMLLIGGSLSAEKWTAVKWLLLVIGGCGTGCGLLWLAWLAARHFVSGLTPFHPFCPYCDAHVNADAVWKCKACGMKNTNTRRFSFLNKCERCGHKPGAYKCSACDNEIVLIVGEFRAVKGVDYVMCKSADPHVACEWMDEASARIKLAEQVDRAKLNQEELEDIRHKTTRAKELCAQLDAELALAERQWRVEHIQKERQSRPSGSELEKDFETQRNRTLGVHKIAATHLKKMEQEHANNPEEFKQEEMFTKSWVAQKLGRVE